MTSLSTRYPDALEAMMPLSFGETIDYPLSVGVVHILLERAQRHPDAVAVEWEGHAFHYRELIDRVRATVHSLRRKGVGSGDRVAVSAEASFERIVASLAVIGTGAVLVPLAPTTPRRMVEYVLADADVAAILGPSIPDFAVETRRLGWATDGDAETELASVDSTSDACIFYTSGTTGRPKGIVVQHRGLVNRLLWMVDHYGISNDDRVMPLASFSFDVTLWETICPLLVGGTVVLPSEGLVHDPSSLAAALARHRITMIETVPTLLSRLVDEKGFRACTALRHVVCASDVMPPALPGKFAEASSASLHNAYGPTETSIDSTVFRAVSSGSPATSVPIGKPIANTSVYILDDELQLVPVGAVGEIVIGGIGVARGYLGQPELTAAKFVPDPFRDEPGARMYRTGDLGRFLADGNLEFCGRRDDQVKIRGHRVELGEVEATLLTHPVVREGVVVARPGPAGELRLIAYVATHAGASLSTTELRVFIGERVPDYMVPPVVIFMESLPLTSNGKVDRLALPDPEGSRPEVANAYEAPSEGLEQIIAEVWTEVLGLDRVGANDNFFDLGGDSILAVLVAVQLRDGLMLKTNVRQVLDNPVLRGFAAAVADVEPDERLLAVLAQVEAMQPDALQVLHSGR